MRKIIYYIVLGLLIVFITFLFLKNDYRKIFTYWETTPQLQRSMDENTINRIIEYNDIIIETSRKYDISPIAIAGIILTEHSLHTGPVNYFEEYYVKEHFLNKPVEYLEKLADATETDVECKKMKGESQHEFLYRVKKGLIWSIGICQMSIIKARNLEENLYVVENREKRNVKEIITNLLIPKESVNYCGFELYNIKQTFLVGTGIDISQNPEILATLYNTGRVDEIVLKYIKGGTKKPKSNVFGKYITKHKKAIEGMLKTNSELLPTTKAIPNKGFSGKLKDNVSNEN